MNWRRAARDQGNYREIAFLWLVAASLLGAGGLFIASLAAIWTYGDFRDGRVSLAFFSVSALLYVSLAAGPVAGWVLFARRRHWLAMAIAAPPVVLALLSAPQLVR